jgi:hypothetical protein
LVVIYENATMPETAVSIVINEKDEGASVNYQINELVPINNTNPVGLAIHSDILWDTIQDGSHISVNGNYLGLIGGSDNINSPRTGAGVKGHFYYENNTLFGLDDDVANNTMAATDGLADISGYVTNNATSFEVTLIKQPTAPYNIYLAFLASYTTPCTEFPTTLSNDTTLCYGATVGLEATGGSAYEWFPQKNLSCYNCANPTFTGDSTTLYTVRIRNGANCSKVLPVRVEVLPELKTQSVSTTTSICGEDGAEVTLNAIGGRAPL